MQQIANSLSDQDLDNICSDEASHCSIDESDNRSVGDEDVDIHTREIRLSTASIYTHKAYSPVSIKPLTASTALCVRSGKYCCDPDDPVELELTDLDVEVTPIRSISKGLCSCESGMKTPDSTELSGHLNHSETAHEPVGSEAEALLRAKRSFRRVRCQLPADSSEGFPDGSDSDYTQPSTQKWVESHHNPPTAGSVTGQNRPQDRSPSIGAQSSSTKPGSLISDSYSPSLSENHKSRVPSGPNMSASLSDLRDPNGALLRHQARLTSEAGSKSSLSLASNASTESKENGDKLREMEERLIEKKTLQTLTNALPVPELAQTRRRSRTLTEEEFKELFCRPLDELVARGQPKPMTGSMRSLRHINSSRFTSPLHSRGSMLSIYSERESSYTHGIKITGDLRLDIQYDHQSSTLRIAVKQARDLAIADKKNQSCNPYVKSYLLPDKTKASKRKTSSKKHTRNPVYEEEIKYRISYSDLSERSLQIAVWHKPGVGTNLFLGEVIIPFADFQFDTGAQWYPLSERRQGALPSSLQIYRGELLLALKLVPGGTLGNQSELHVWIKSAKGLTTSGSGASKSASVDPYAKIYLLPERSKDSKRKTKTLKKTNSPDWNTNFVYKNINRNRLAEIGIEVSVWDHDRFSTNDFLGGCRLNNGSLSQRWMDATGTEQSVWLAMMERPQTWFEGLIRLRPNLD
ncbi:Synaptotagmin protein 4 [Paragonimus heterotremus]|uniref:Synaptotagmin protein 4 n=1 Tax=Paragonimus heterotremus TaxID=100268 RepID=A0A8J4WST4_9TREM|nr:Synaptotagmin protein 4 [Paragonimus heterotremus]